MYYEEKKVKGVLHWRSSPKGGWQPCTPERLTKKVDELMLALAEQKQAIRETSAVAIAMLYAHPDYRQYALNEFTVEELGKVSSVSTRLSEITTVEKVYRTAFDVAFGEERQE